MIGRQNLIVAVMICAASVAAAADIKIIANSSVKASEISTEELKGVFLATKTSLGDGSHVTPVVAKGGAAHEAFIGRYLGKTDAALQTYYRSLVFTGKGGMPKMLPSDADISAYVAKTPGAIGYVSSGTEATGTKTLAVK